MGWQYFRYWIPAVLAGIGVAASIGASTSCETVQVQESQSSFGLFTATMGRGGGSPMGGGSGGGGGGGYVSSDCQSYSSYDGAHRAARIFAILSVVFAAVGVLFLVFAPCHPANNSNSAQQQQQQSSRRSKLVSTGWKVWAGIYAVWIPLLEGLTFLIYKSDFCSDNYSNNGSSSMMMETSGCEWSEGSTARVLAMLLFFGAGISMLVLGAPQFERSGVVERQAVTYERQMQPDGTVVVVATSIDKQYINPKQ